MSEKQVFLFFETFSFFVMAEIFFCGVQNQSLHEGLSENILTCLWKEK